MRRQDDEHAGLDGGAERPEDPFRDQQGVQVGGAQRAGRQVAEPVRDHRGEQAQRAAHGPQALDRRALAPDVGLPGDQGLLQPAQNVPDVPGLVEGGPHVVQADAGVGHLADPQQADHVVVAVAAASVSASCGLRQQTDLVVVTNGARGGSGEGGGIADLDLAGRRGGGIHRRQGLPCCWSLDDTTCRYGMCNSPMGESP